LIVTKPSWIPSSVGFDRLKIEWASIEVPAVVRRRHCAFGCGFPLPLGEGLKVRVKSGVDLTPTLSQRERERIKKPLCLEIASWQLALQENGRGERIRTSDLSVPNRALYQAEPRPELRKGILT
jgi:hypothetical protein